MWRYLAKRLVLAAGSLGVLTFAAFIALRFIPGDTFTVLASGRAVDPVLLSEWRVRYGLDQPIVPQYLIYLRNLLKGDFGVSYYTGRSVSEVLTPALLTTMQWQIPALLVAIAAAVMLATAMTLSRDRWLNSAFTLILLVGISLPEFAIAAFLVAIFAVKLHILPVAGVLTPMHFILPALTMGIYQCSVFCRILRSELFDAMSQDYVRTAVAKGLSHYHILKRHVLPNAIVPFLAMAGIQIGRAIGGAFLIETIYNIPGLGRLAVLAVIQRDYPIVLAVTIVMTIGFVVSNLMIDFLYGMIDKRISLTEF